MYDLNKIRAFLKERSLQEVAEKTGVHYNTLLAIRDGTNTNPTFVTLTKIQTYIHFTQCE